MVEAIEDIFSHPKVVVHQRQMAPCPVSIEHSMNLDQPLELENMRFCLLRVYKDYLHHSRFIHGPAAEHKPRGCLL